jgi:hypothetical protein
VVRDLGTETKGTGKTIQILANADDIVLVGRSNYKPQCSREGNLQKTTATNSHLIFLQFRSNYSLLVYVI